MTFNQLGIIILTSRFKIYQSKRKEHTRMTNTELLEERIKLSGYQKNFIAKTLGLTPYGLALKISNKSEFKASEIEALSDLLGIDSWEDRSAIFFAE